MTPVTRISLAFLITVCTTILPAQDRHLSNDTMGTLYTESPFAHGYIHGYEQGFHFGDLDLQLGRNPRDPEMIAEYKHGDEYVGRFGSKNSYKTGYRNGFRSGYSDAIREIPFRAIVSLRVAADGLAKKVWADVRVFDRGFREGYDHGKFQGAEDGRARAELNPINPPCLGLPDEYCSGFARGFQMGYGDGYNNQAPRKVEVSSAK